MHSIVVISPEPAAPSETFIRAHLNNLPFNVIPLYRWRAPYLGPNGLIATIPGYLRAFSERMRLPVLPHLFGQLAICQTAEWIKSVKPGVVLAEYGPVGANVLDACELANVPLVVFFHGYDAYHRATLDAYRSGYSKLFSRAVAIIVPSIAMRSQLIYHGAHPERIVVNPYGVDPNLFVETKPGLNKPVFFSVGRFVGKKGPLHTIRAFAKVHQRLPVSRLIMIGAGPLLDPSRVLAADLGVNHAIQFLGACKHATVQAHLQHARAVVQHSLLCESGDQEGTPVALIEAQMAGVPVVATHHAGIPDVVLDSRTGFLVPEGDVEGMAEAMLKLGQDPQLAGEMGLAARAHALKHHTMDRHIQSLTTTIHVAINRHTAAAST